MIRVLGRQTSGNVQKVLFLLEEIGLKYLREDYGRQFNNTNTDHYRKLNPNMKVPTVVDGEVVIWESHTILRYLSALHQPKLTGATPAERTYVERWMDWLLASLNTPYVAVFKDAKKPPAERGADFAAQSADLVAQLKILEGHIAGKSWLRARPVDARRYCARTDRRALPRFPDRAAAFRRARPLDVRHPITAGFRRRDGR